MKKTTHIILTPVYNDWKSLNRLISEIDVKIEEINNFRNEILVINDCSTKKIYIKRKKLKNIKQINSLTLEKNCGSQKAIAVGLFYLKQKKKNFYITVMDSDGEDQPKEIVGMVRTAKKFKEFVITSNRKKRKESFYIRFLYNIHLIMTFFFTFKWMSFGNFTTFHSNNLEKILKRNESWLAHSSAVIKNCNIKRVFAKRGKRYFDKSKLSLFNLIEHSLRVNAVFSNRIFFSSIFYIFIFKIFIMNVFIQIILSSLIMIFCFLIIIVKKKHSDKFFELEGLIKAKHLKNSK